MCLLFINQVKKRISDNYDVVVLLCIYSIYSDGPEFDMHTHLFNLFNISRRGGIIFEIPIPTIFELCI